jgi:peroxiredoxin
MRKYALLLTIVAFLAACNSNEYKVSGKIEGLTDGQAVLKKIESQGAVSVDTALIVDGAFSFTGSIQFPELYLIYIGENPMPIPLFLENGSIDVKADADSLQGAEISGSELNMIFKRFNDEVPSNDRVQEIRGEFMAAQQEGNQEVMEQLSAEMQIIMEAQRNYYSEFVYSNTNNVVGAFLGMNMANSLPFEKLDSLVTVFEGSLPGHPYVEEMKKMVEPMMKQKEAETAIQIGKKAPAFELANSQDEKVSLDSFKGKYVLLDFWASWCRPCREENPNLKKAIEQFGGENFEIVSVSLDKTNEPWLKAVDEDGMSWTQLHDPEGDVANIYGVQSIPFTLLLDKEGNIIEKNLRGEALAEKLDELF